MPRRSGLKRAEAAGKPAPPLLDCFIRGSRIFNIQGHNVVYHDRER